MATNQGNGVRKRTEKNRTQVLNRITGNYIKRDAKTGRFIAVKKDGKPYKGIRKEKAGVISNPNVSKDTAQKAEEAIILYNLKHSSEPL